MPSRAVITFRFLDASTILQSPSWGLRLVKIISQAFTPTFALGPTCLTYSSTLGIHGEGLRVWVSLV